MSGPFLPLSPEVAARAIRALLDNMQAFTGDDERERR